MGRRGRRGRSRIAYWKCRGVVRWSRRGRYALAKDVIHPNIDGVEGLRIFVIEGGILGCHVGQISFDSRNILPNLRELTCLDIIDSSFDGHTFSEFLTELQNSVSILRGGLQHAENILFRLPGHISEARKGATSIDVLTEHEHVMSGPRGGCQQAGNILFRLLYHSREAREVAKSRTECVFRFCAEQGDIRTKSPTVKLCRFLDGREEKIRACCVPMMVLVNF
jgi:hypothetical protein